MIARYRLLAERLRVELENLERVVGWAEGALDRAIRNPQDQDYYLAAAALDLHGFYAGLERLFELIADEMDNSRPGGVRWHRNLLAQMALAVPDLRPAVVAPDTAAALTEYLEFRHVVRNVYTFNLKPDRIAQLVRDLRPTFDQTRRELLAFAGFLNTVSTADQASTP
jgi:hypothetical protein